MSRLFLALLALAVAFPGCGKKQTPPEGAIMKVNGVYIQRAPVEKLAAALREQFVASQPTAVFGGDGQIKKSAARQFVANQLLLEEARAMHLSYDSAMAEGQYQQFRQQVGEERFAEELKASGKTEAEARSYMAEGLLIDALVKKLLAGIDSIPWDACKKYYAENQKDFERPAQIRARQILLLTPKGMDPKLKAGKRETIERLLTQLRSGGDFAKLAKENSDDPNAKDGGDIGWFKRGDLMKEIESVCFALQKDEISPVVESSVGFHILQKTDEKQETAAAPYEDVKNQIRMTLEFKHRGEFIKTHMDGLIAKADIAYIDTLYKP